jgi:endonuclease G
MAFLIPNKPIEGPDKDYLVSIDKIEKLTGLDFLSKLNDPQEEKLEKEAVDDVWKINE